MCWSWMKTDIAARCFMAQTPEEKIANRQEMVLNGPSRITGAAVFLIRGKPLCVTMESL